MSKTVMQDMHVTPDPPMPYSAVRPLECDRCKRGLDAGYSIAAKMIAGKNVMLCELHY